MKIIFLMLLVLSFGCAHPKPKKLYPFIRTFPKNLEKKK